MESWADIQRAENGYDYGDSLDFTADEMAEWQAESEGGVLDVETVLAVFRRDERAEAAEAARRARGRAAARAWATTTGRNAMRGQ